MTKSKAKKAHKEVIINEKASLNNPPATKLLIDEENAKRWKNWRIRGFWTIIMVVAFFMILSVGPIPTLLLIFAIQIRIYHEIINLSIIPNKELKLPWMRAINWYFFLVANNFLFWESLIKYFKGSINSNTILKFLATHHRFKSFLFYCSGFVLFVINLKKGYYRFQFRMFAVTHMLILLVVASSHFIVANVLEGFIWFLLPVSLVIVNDIGAYMAGFFFGRTPLIELSPKKTWEGFIGGLIVTVLFGFGFSYLISLSNYLICPIHDLTVTFFSTNTCTLNPVFLPATYRLPEFISSYIGISSLTFKPILLHSLVMAIFASLIAPFGGFFASGFKRAFNIKDFANVIPGHGGLTDRFDCQFLMGVFSYFYYSSFIKIGRLEVDGLFDAIVYKLTADQQIFLFNKLQEYLVSQNIINVN
ncbi:phosphatidate cytidylyltransferase [Neoconidiobolus thromboides FSU 785]|nr:phosphatidate cytidylyltransferase [Neoconidiobolus thromboides FSU 785]